jgi:hypothetical protein
MGGEMQTPMRANPLVWQSREKSPHHILSKKPPLFSPVAGRPRGAAGRQLE